MRRGASVHPCPNQTTPAGDDHVPVPTSSATAPHLLCNRHPHPGNHGSGRSGAQAVRLRGSDGGLAVPAAPGEATRRPAQVSDLTPAGAPVDAPGSRRSGELHDRPHRRLAGWEVRRRRLPCRERSAWAGSAGPRGWRPTWRSGGLRLSWMRPIHSPRRFPAMPRPLAGCVRRPGWWLRVLPGKGSRATGGSRITAGGAG